MILINYDIMMIIIFNFLITNNPSITVEIPPPIKPSQVFFGDNFINGVRPKKKPNIYAITSFMTIILTGTMNLKTMDINNRINRYLTYIA